MVVKGRPKGANLYCCCFWGARYKVHFFHFVITMLSALSMNISFFVFIYLASFFFVFLFARPF